MFLAELVCSDEECELTLEAVGHLADLELLVCEECRCCLQVVAVSAYEAVRLLQPVERLRAA